MSNPPGRHAGPPKDLGQPELARQVALALSDYRWRRSLSQQRLAEILGVKQPQIARLESGSVNPNMDTLLRISERLGIEFTLEVRPAGLTVSCRPTPRRGSRPA